MGDADVINGVFAPFANNGCSAMFSCKDYSVGMTGAQIKQSVENMIVTNHVKECGSTYLSNGCQVTLNGCNDCNPSIPCGALPSGVTFGACY
ncbi:uncharacterized protein N7458_009851 [Penicillium daleae]|uniref:Uncharacterized protein n=1 Tax=Penicillium daleae TaxID=63821 RepID=A0AAD6FYE8_9EURO|nr:uncharacterized protein N7458_009851 [Penicillium daleae]KAJ5438853.1 hypothetical protein N7458_009851 [Penicillium daleae]